MPSRRRGKKSKFSSMPLPLGIKGLPNNVIFEILYRCDSPQVLAVALCHREAINVFQNKYQPDPNAHITKWNRNVLDRR
ncbi:hypothetical protein HDU76_010886 [Blyttiomyces sp. JEL0837]|nr:hypothetical protein HDU76_010886 [Blyttiomyces sp. JEL0837]